MEIKGSYILPCDKQRAWEALNDCELLKSCLTGCEHLERDEQGVFEGTVKAKIGPVTARFKGTMVQTNVNAPDNCTMNFEGQGGVAGFAKGAANVSLEEAEAGTQLTYVADAKIGGKLAQLGARLVEGTARSMAEDFFGKMAVALAGAENAGGSTMQNPTTQGEGRAGADTEFNQRPKGNRSLIIAALIAAAIILAWVVAG